MLPIVYGMYSLKFPSLSLIPFWPLVVAASIIIIIIIITEVLEKQIIRDHLCNGTIILLILNIYIFLFSHYLLSSPINYYESIEQ